MYDAAIFADTGAEPEKVYAHLNWLVEQIDGHFPLYAVQQGNIEEDVLRSVSEGKRVSQPPFFVLNREGVSGMPPDTGGVLWRQCTKEYKLRPIRQKIGELRKASGASHIFQHIGISSDEAGRMRKSDVQYMTNVYPLYDMKMTRTDCLTWMAKHGYPEPPKSACFFCPYISGARWRQVKETDPETFARAVAFDHAIRRGKLPGVTGDVFLHRSFIPLEEAIKTDADTGQERLFDPYGFENECEGMCGV